MHGASQQKLAQLLIVYKGDKIKDERKLNDAKLIQIDCLSV